MKNYFLALFSLYNYTIFGILKHNKMKCRLTLLTGLLFFLFLNFGFAQTDDQQAVQSSKSKEPKYSTPGSYSDAPDIVESPVAVYSYRLNSSVSAVPDSV